MDSTVTACVVALYPSPGGATESELHFESWNRMRELNPVLRGLEPDIEGLVVNRLADPAAYAIAPFAKRLFLANVGILRAWLAILSPEVGGEYRPLSEVVWALLVMAAITVLCVQSVGGYRPLIQQSRTRLVLTSLAAPLVTSIVTMLIFRSRAAFSASSMAASSTTPS